ncbi:DoxX family membrane protein [Cumulibacter manganitolerans]|uniref:DoxX family membrane protein n=1 Tax=Cumulibacter manganitolerans TaxID=1884992 RepID=UPI0012964EF0|nr:DoxX family membrane protein [Cumulibacter manganitolerans]
MGLVRALARPMLAAPFVMGGINQLTKPAELGALARPFISRIAEPAGLPNDPELLVKANGALMITAGAGLATGVLRKPSAAALAASLVPTTLAAHSFWEMPDEKEKAVHRNGFFNNLGLLGGLILTIVDTEGKPGLLYRARMAKRGAGHSAKAARREAKHAARAARREAKIALLSAKDAVS